ncbi:MAG: Single-stranded DNA-binding protein DdrA [bacterium ADurb.Bin400]|nr:MAG: Single-stranded DNA-binding protein DdrA [bacterium ADurb.Bin400]
MDLGRLQEPFSAEDIEWRVGVMNADRTSGTALPYVTNRAIQDRLDGVTGPQNWRNEFEKWNDKGVKCGISIRFDGEWVTKYDGADEPNIEPTKGGFSDAMKRAAVQWGIGRYLYSMPIVWVPLEQGRIAKETLDDLYKRYRAYVKKRFGSS